METNVNVQNNDEVEIDLREILFVLLDKYWLYCLWEFLPQVWHFLGQNYLSHQSTVRNVNYVMSKMKNQQRMQTIM